MSNAFGSSPPSKERHSILGDVQRASNIAQQERSFALEDAANHLLDRSLQGLHDQDEERAATFLRRAAELPWDEHEHVHPATMAAHMLLFNAIVDAMAESPAHDGRWLTVALDVVENTGERAAEELRSVLVTVREDQHPSRQDADRIRQALGTGPPDPACSAFGLTSASTPDQVAEVVAPILEAFLAYYREFYEGTAAG